jgi:hypothetical protein
MDKDYDALTRLSWMLRLYNKICETKLSVEEVQKNGHDINLENSCRCTIL